MHLEIKISLHFNTIFQSKDPEKILTNIKFLTKISLKMSLKPVGKSSRNNYDNLQEL